MGSYRLLEHTADMGIEAAGESREELFAQAAYGLMAIISQEAEVAAREERAVEVTGGDVDELLVNWLNEVLYLFESGFFPADFELEEVGGEKVKARVRGERFDPDRHPIEREVKAATYHRLQVEQRGEEWRAQVYLDL